MSMYYEKDGGLLELTESPKIEVRRMGALFEEEDRYVWRSMRLVDPPWHGSFKTEREAVMHARTHFLQFPND